MVSTIHQGKNSQGFSQFAWESTSIERWFHTSMRVRKQKSLVLSTSCFVELINRITLKMVVSSMKVSLLLSHPPLYLQQLALSLVHSRPSVNIYPLTDCSQHLLYEPSSVFYILTCRLHLIFIPPLRCSCYYFFHFTREETEAQRN